MTLAKRIVAEHQRVIWPIVGALLLNIAILLLIVYPFSRKVAGGQEAAAAAAAELAAARREHNAARATVTGKAQADAELRKFYSEVLPSDLSGARSITYLYLRQLAQQTNLQSERGQAEVSKERDSHLEKLTMTTVLTGDYANIRRFIHQLETAPEFLVIEDVALGQQQERGGISLTARVATYYRTGGNGN
jgi:Tfp pilus assembly protein PilO